MTLAPPKGGAFTLSDPAAFHFVQRDLIAATVVEAGRASRLRTLGSNGTVNRLKEFAQGVGHDSVAFRVGRNVEAVVTRDMAHFVLNRCHTPTRPVAPGLPR